VKLVVTVSTTVSKEGVYRTYDCHGGNGEEGVDNENWSSGFGVGIKVPETNSKEKTRIREQSI
jgi:hypothetical protein